ncbi:MAG TPA: UDP-4-amino-4,6-dideoxy-N-acetyl-beta-L-altrosamine transaminase [Alphaproteobacteria bacterium]|nr:UDP-4-amino-4,6-dideoxy-N-acetyl-beta-L-altrosamine transaminase [Alphaproteobacteria bacterium]
MPFIPYSRQNIDDDDIEAVVKVLRSDFLTQGPAIEAFEKAFVARHNMAHGVAVCNATAALHIACLALGAGPGAWIWTSPNSFAASANCALYCGAKVDFVDVDPATRNMSVAALRDKLAKTPKEKLPKILIPVDFSGLPCDAREMRDLAGQYGFKILEDASHAAGAVYDGQPVGSLYADAAVFSFHAVKIITAGEGGLVATNDAALAQKLRLLRAHGITRDAGLMKNEPPGAWYYEQIALGFNYRITDIQAALGLSQLRRIDQLRQAREKRAVRYDKLLAPLPLILPPRQTDRLSSWHLYAVEINEMRTAATRAGVFGALRAAQIGVNVHYIPIHLQPYYARLGFKRGDFPYAERYYDRAISLPLFPAMTDAQQDTVVAALADALGVARTAA